MLLKLLKQREHRVTAALLGTWPHQADEIRASGCLLLADPSAPPHTGRLRGTARLPDSTVAARLKNATGSRERGVCVCVCPDPCAECISGNTTSWRGTSSSSPTLFRPLRLSRRFGSHQLTRTRSSASFSCVEGLGNPGTIHGVLLDSGARWKSLFLVTAYASSDAPPPPPP
ncbi:hypothetical protein LZ30DRAFT_331034 [Colletotrichum cereale]|nr:hypothetical protein LZ30DRAFT_331034 [Colletotrichum cereale]